MQQNAIYIHQLVFFSSQFITSCHFLYQIVGCYFWTPWLFEELNGQHTNRMHTKKLENDLFMKLEFADSRIQIEAFAGYSVMRIWLFDKQILIFTDTRKGKAFQMYWIRSILSLNSRWSCPSMALNSEGIPNTMLWSSCCGCLTASTKTSTLHYHPRVETAGSKAMERLV